MDCNPAAPCGRKDDFANRGLSLWGRFLLVVSGNFSVRGWVLGLFWCVVVDWFGSSLAFWPGAVGERSTPGSICRSAQLDGASVVQEGVDAHRAAIGGAQHVRALFQRRVAPAFLEVATHGRGNLECRKPNWPCRYRDFVRFGMGARLYRHLPDRPFRTLRDAPGLVPLDRARV